MYIDSISIENFRTFRRSKVAFTHPDQEFKALDIPTPALPNVNLILGTNGFGKTTLLKAIALAALGPAVSDSGIFPYRLIRREPTGSSNMQQPQQALIEAAFTPHDQDHTPTEVKRVESRITIIRRGDLESLRWTHEEDKSWHPIFSSTSDAFFFVGCDASRRKGGAGGFG